MSIPKNIQNTYKTNLLVGSGNPMDPFTSITGCPLGGLILQPRKSVYLPTTLGSTIKIYVGTQHDVSSLALWVANNNYSYSVDELPDQNFQITITLPYDEITNVDNLVNERVQWEITPNIVHRDLFDAGIFIPYPTSALLNTTRRYTVPGWARVTIKEALKYGNFGQLNFNNGPGGGSLTAAQQIQVAPLKIISQQLFYLLKTGVTSVQASTIHLKRVAVYSINDLNAYDANPYYSQVLSPVAFQQTNINPIISRQDLIRLFSPDPVTTQQLLPSYAIPKAISAAPFNDPTDLFALAGYLVHVPIRTFLSPTKVQITQLFEWDEWYDACYTRFSPISNFPLLYPSPYPDNYAGVF